MPLSSWGVDYMAALAVGQVTPMATLWVALCTSIPGPDDTGTSITGTIELDTAVGYSRQQIWLDGASWTTPASGVTVYVPQLSYSIWVDWPVAVAYALVDADIDGNIFGYEYLTNPVTLKPGSSITTFGPSLGVI